jgi:hypothetical protein
MKSATTPKTKAKRLKMLIKYFGMNESQFANKCGLHQQSINRLTRNDNANPGGMVLDAFKESFPMINANWLLWGEGVMVTSDTKSKAELVEIQTVPGYGYDSYRDPDLVKEELFTHWPLYNSYNSMLPDSLMSFEITSRRMEPIICERDVCLCRSVPIADLINLNNEVVFIVSNRYMGLGVVSDQNRDKIVLSGLNAIHKDIEIKKLDIKEVWMYIQHKSTYKHR